MSPTPVPPGQPPVVPATSGPPRVEAFASAIERAASQSGRRRVAVLTHRNPDPDAMGACVGMRMLLRELGFEAEVHTMGRIYRAENLAMIRELKFDFLAYEALDVDQVCGAVLVDTQPGFGHTFVPDDLPVLAVFDHHLGSNAESEASREIPFKDVRLDVGATSSIVFSYLEAVGAELDTNTATALFCGVRYDTGDLSVDATDLDEEAYFHCLRRADREALSAIQRPRLPQSYYRELHRALRMARRFGPAVVGLLGQVENPESVAELADFFVRMHGCEWALVGGTYEGEYYLSLRTRLGGRDAYGILSVLLDGEGSFGGHGRIAGGRVALGEAGKLGARRLERRIRTRVLRIVDPEKRFSDDERLGGTLT
ncbi:putative manganese-dependent inorganic pyrophosphatase [Planctomycetes bacterium Pla163]|jgi:nanoRNase/pAp phosphatase (c-di-AMP/oligoRNAs hydrolase)|uniref:Putative manganese-dependent inorganic pyrophosphatase n=1 Tax=Rohdeia mirabilis TaxID=2528008 RepID=A0A518CXY0_9BACT|nr:putative manganese-dependent inorganic pyrophosphatase [Planctomycetes bacterium Pla163]